MEIGSQITAWRRYRDLTQAALAARAGLSRPYVSRLERGDADPALSSLRRLAVAFDITPGRLLDELPPQARLNPDELDALARGSIQPGGKTALGPAETRALARMLLDRRQALGLYRPRKDGGVPRHAGKHSARWLKARLGQDQWQALLRRIDKLASLHAR